MEDKLIYIVINEILKEHDINAFWEEPNIPEIDGFLKLDYKGYAQRFNVKVKKELRNFQLNHIINLAENYYPFLVIAETLFPKIKNALIENGIAYIDLNGNMNIVTENILLKVDGKRQKHLQKEKYGRAFTKAGLKVILIFLFNENEINDTYREIAKNAGIAIGNVKLILDGLIEEGFALRKNEKELKLTNKEDLLQRWVTAYTEKLKPTLHIGNFKFANPEDFLRWKELNIDMTQTFWGGETAGNIYTDYLHPEVLTLYTIEKKTDLIKNYRLIPDPKGNVTIFEKFWKDNQDNTNVVPPIIAYADLLATGNRRCIETAQKIYEQHIENTLQ
jgi:hypothetical protein